MNELVARIPDYVGVRDGNVDRAFMSDPLGIFRMKILANSTGQFRVYNLSSSNGSLWNVEDRGNERGESPTGCTVAAKSGNRRKHRQGFVYMCMYAHECIHGACMRVAFSKVEPHEASARACLSIFVPTPFFLCPRVSLP